MLTGGAVDTILNLMTFLFIGAMAWLLWRDLPDRPDRRGPPDGD